MNSPVFVSRATMGHDAMAGMHEFSKALAFKGVLRDWARRHNINLHKIGRGLCWRCCPLIRQVWEANA